MKDAIAFIEASFGAQYAFAASVLVAAYWLLIALVRLLELWGARRTRKQVLEEWKLHVEVVKLHAEAQKLRREAGLQPTDMPAEWALAQISTLPPTPALSFSGFKSRLLPSVQKPPPGFPRARWSFHRFVVRAATLWLLVAMVSTLLPHEMALPPIAVLATVYAFLLAHALVRSVYHFVIGLVAKWKVQRDSRDVTV